MSDEYVGKVHAAIDTNSLLIMEWKATTTPYITRI